MPSMALLPTGAMLMRQQGAGATGDTILRG